jgi:hypothetical protein
MRRFKNNYTRKTEISRHRDAAEIESRLSRLVKTDQAEELPRERPELEAFGAEWIRAWAPHARERLIEIAKVLRRYPWMVGVVRQKPVNNPHPYMVEVYVAVEGSEACLALNHVKALCTRGGVVRKARLELEFARLEPHEGKMREVYRPKGLLAFAAAAGEYMRLL